MRLRDCKVGMRVRVKVSARHAGKIGTIRAVRTDGMVSVRLRRFLEQDGAWIDEVVFDPRNLEPAPAKRGR